LSEGPYVDQVATIFERLGAEPQQAKTMAKQLLKRAEQLSAEQDVTPVEALQELLQKAVQGRQGFSPSEKEGQGPDSSK